jgi:hypothetical protein
VITRRLQQAIGFHDSLSIICRRLEEVQPCKVHVREFQPRGWNCLACACLRPYGAQNREYQCEERR